MAHFTVMPIGPNCLNCQAALPGTARFCAQCGQKVDARRLTLHDIGHELWHALTHTDRSVLGVMKAMLLRPGLLARDYVQGRRRRHFSPFAFLVIATGLVVLLNLLTGIGGFSDPKMHPGPVGRFLNKHLNLFVLAQVPLLALWSRLLFWRSGMNLAENLVLAAYASGMRALFSLAVGLAVLALDTLQPGMRGSAPVFWTQAAVSLSIWFGYSGWASAQFHRGSAWRWHDWLRGSLVALLTQATSTLLVWLAFYLYYRTQ